MKRATPGGGRRIRAYAYTLVTTAIVLFFALAEWGAEGYVAGRSPAAGRTLEVLIVLVAALVFRPIHRRVESAVDQAFYKRKRNALAAIARFRRDLSSYNDAQQLLRRVIEAVEQHLEARACAVYLRRDTFRAEASSFDVAAGEVSLDDPLVIRLRSSSSPAEPRALNSSASGTHAFAMMISGDLIGFLVVHAKESYDDEEAQMLAGLAQDLAAALVSLDPRLRPRKAGAPNNIPSGLPALVGRERELAEIKAALAQSRLVTLTGAGGVGKTSLALQYAAAALAQHEHGAWFVNFAPIADGSLVATTILAAMDAAGVDGGDAQQRLIDYLRARDVLLVLDNCEQILPDVARTAAQIRAACPDVTILATSREMLHLEGEQVYRVGSLRADAAIELFCRRAQAVSQNVQLDSGAVRAICENLEGIALAIELAAARTRTLSPDEILAHLNERFRLLTGGTHTALPRHRTLAATMEWSYGLLTAEEQSLFRRLPVFRGSFSLAAAAAVCVPGDKCDEFHMLDLLTSLADKSLLTVTLGLTTRYRLLETIRQFAAQKAVEQGAAATAQQQHASYFAALAAHAYHEFDTSVPAGWLEKLKPDIDNFRAALSFTLEGEGNRISGAQLAADCGPLFLRMELLGEGLRWCDAARSVGGLAPAAAGRIEYVASMLYNNSRAYDAALASAERAVSSYRRSQDRRGLIRALSQLARQYARARREDEAQQLAMEAIEGARHLGEPRVLAAVLRRCAYSLPPAQIARARELFSEALAVAERAGDADEPCMILQWWAGSEAAARCFDRAMDLGTRALQCASADTTMYIESDVAGYALASGDFAAAEQHATRALELATAFEHSVLTALALAYCAPAVEDANDGALLFGYAGARLRDLQFQGDLAEKAALFNALERIRRRLDAAQAVNLLNEGCALSEDRAREIALRGSALRRGHDAPVDGAHGVGALLRQ